MIQGKREVARLEALRVLSLIVTAMTVKKTLLLFLFTGEKTEVKDRKEAFVWS